MHLQFDRPVSICDSVWMIEKREREKESERESKYQMVIHECINLCLTSFKSRHIDLYSARMRW